MTLPVLCESKCLSTGREPLVHTDSGQAFPLMVLLTALLAGVALLMAQLGGEAVKTARLEAVADAAALTGSRFGIDAAAEVAELNGAELISGGFAPDTSSAPLFEVEVSSAGRRAFAAATQPQPSLTTTPTPAPLLTRPASAFEGVLPLFGQNQPADTVPFNAGSSFAPFRP